MVQDTVRAVWALLLGIAIMMVGNGLQGSLLGVRANLEGFDATTIGIIMSGYYLGFFISSIITPRLVSQVGHIRVFAAYASLASAAILVHTLLPSALLWMALRFLSGLAIAGLFVVSESWLNQTATNETRGKIFSIYMMISSGAVAIGQFALPLADPAGPNLFIVVSVLVSVALVPIALSKVQAPTILTLETISIREIYRLSPLGVVGSFLIGMGQGGFMSLGPVYAAQIGLTATEIAIFMSLPFAGLLIIQYPLGALSDRMDRRRVIAFCAAIGASAAAFIPQINTETRIILFGLYAIYGVLSIVLYGLIIAHANDYVPTEKILPASAILVLIYAVGSFIGPVFSGYAMQNLGSSALFMLGALIMAGVAFFTLYRMTRRSALTTEERNDFVPLGYRSSPIATAAAIEWSNEAAIDEAQDENLGDETAPLGFQSVPEGSSPAADDEGIVPSERNVPD